MPPRGVFCRRGVPEEHAVARAYRRDCWLLLKREREKKLVRKVEVEGEASSLLFISRHAGRRGALVALLVTFPALIAEEDKFLCH